MDYTESGKNLLIYVFIFIKTDYIINKNFETIKKNIRYECNFI